MFSALFGSRGSSAGASGRQRKGAANSPQPESPPTPRERPNHETLAAVIATQKKRKRACVRQATKAEHRRDSLLHKAETCVQPMDVAALNEKAAAAENMRKSKTAEVITLQAQIDVLVRVLTEHGMKNQDLDEDFDVANERMNRDEDRLGVDQQNAKEMLENAEEMSLLLSRNIALPLEGEDEEDVREAINDFEQGEAM